MDERLEGRGRGRKGGRRNRRERVEELSCLGSLGSSQLNEVGTRAGWLFACCVLVSCTFPVGRSCLRKTLALERHCHLLAVGAISHHYSHYQSPHP